MAPEATTHSSTELRRRWLAFVLWTLAIFAAVPFANDIQEWIVDHLGENAVRIALTVVLAAAGLALNVWIMRWLPREIWGSRGKEETRAPAAPWSRLVWLFGIGAVAVLAMWRLRVAAEPAHLAEYAVLGVLAFRALSVHLGDHGVYPAAAALVAIFGTLDEVFQWLLPDRYWDLGDVGLNVGAAILVQVLIWRVFRPRGISPGISTRSLRVAVRLLAFEVVLLALCLANTPTRIDGYAARVPGLGYLGKDQSTRMTEYGHGFFDPEIGRFQSRLTPEELRTADRQQGARAGKILDQVWHRGGLHRLQRLYPPGKAPLVFEAGTHLFYRQHMWKLAQETSDSGEKARLATIAYRQNLILERYFPHTLASSHRALPARARARMEKLQQPAEFHSEVSNWLHTDFTEAQARWILLAMLAGLVAVDRICSRRLAR